MTVYFDHNATTPLNDQVLEQMLPYLGANCANPSSIYAQGRFARNAINIAREQIADLVNVHHSQIVFTSGGTEANNAAIKGTLQGMGLGAVICSAIEHPSVRDTVNYFEGVAHCGTLPVDRSGVVLSDGLDQVCRQETSLLVSVMLANNETGTIQNISVLSDITHSFGHYIHTDAVQAIGKMPVDFLALGVDLMTLSAHKIYGPQGVGALVYDKAIDLEPIIHGGGQEKNLRSGTENVAGIVGFGKAAEIAKNNLKKNQYYLSGLRRYFECQLKRIPGIVLFAPEADRLENTVFFSVPGIDGETLLMQMDERGVAVASGSACASKRGQPSHVLMAMGIDEQTARGAIRVSFGLQNTETEIDIFFRILGAQLTALGLLNAESWLQK